MGYVSNFSQMLDVAADMENKKVTFQDTTIERILSEGLYNIHPLISNNGVVLMYEAIYYYTHTPGPYETSKGYTAAVIAAISLQQLDKNVVMTYHGVSTSIKFADFAQMAATAAGVIQLRYPSASDIGVEPTSYVKLAGLFGLVNLGSQSIFLNCTIANNASGASPASVRGDSYVPVIIRKQGDNFYCLVRENSVNAVWMALRNTDVWKPAIVPKETYVTHKEPLSYACSREILDSQMRFGATYNSFTYYLDENERKAVQVAWNEILSKYQDTLFSGNNLWYGSRLFMKEGQFVKEVRISLTCVPESINPSRLFTCDLQGDGNIFLYYSVGSGYQGSVHNFRVPVTLNEGGWYDLGGSITYNRTTPGSYIKLSLNDEQVSGFGVEAARDTWVAQDTDVDPPSAENDKVENVFSAWHTAFNTIDVFVGVSDQGDNVQRVSRYIPITPFWSSWNVFNPNWLRTQEGLIAGADKIPNMTTSESYNDMIAKQFVYNQDTVNPGSQSGGGTPGSGGDGGDPGTGGGGGTGGGVFDVDDPFSPGGQSPGTNPGGGGGEQPGVGGVTDEVPDTGTVPEPPSVVFGGVSAGLYNVYTGITNDSMQSLNEYLWSTGFWESISKFLEKPLDAILNFGLLPYSPTDTVLVNSINLGNLSFPMRCYACTEQFTVIDCGTVTLNHYHDNAMDYEPFTRVSIYLPFVGTKEIPTADAMDSMINVKYQFDNVTGSGVCLLYISRLGTGYKAPMYQWECNCMTTVPLSGADFSRFYASIASAAIGIVSGGVAGGAAAVANLSRSERKSKTLVEEARKKGRNQGMAMAGAEGAVDIINSGVSIAAQGGIGPAAGLLGPRNPFLIVRRSQPYMPVNYQAFQGFPANASVTLSQLSGFTRVREVHVSGINATDGEIDMIESLLKEGVIL